MLLVNTCLLALTWDRQSVVQTMENTNMRLLVLFGTASCFLTALRGLLPNLGSISPKGGRRSASQPLAACPRLHCTPAQSSSRTGACSLLPVTSLPLGFPLQQGAGHESKVVSALRPISIAEWIQEWCFVLRLSAP